MTSFSVADNGLTITLDPSCDRAELRERLAEIGSDDLLAELTENVRCNSDWDIIPPEAVGALTQAPIIARANWRDNGTVFTEGPAYWFPSYQVTDPVAELIEHGLVVFPKGSS